MKQMSLRGAFLFIGIVGAAFGIDNHEESGTGFSAPSIKSPQTNVSDPAKGDIAIDTTPGTPIFKGYNGSSWVQLDATAPATMIQTPSATSPVIVTAFVTGGSAAVSEDNSGFIAGDCTDTGTGDVDDCTFTTSFFSSKPVCWVQPETSTNSNCNIIVNSTTNFDVNCYSAADNTAADVNFYVICHGVQ